MVPLRVEYTHEHHPVSQETGHDSDDCTEDNIVAMVVVSKNERARHVCGQQQGSQHRQHLPVTRSPAVALDAEMGEQVDREVSQSRPGNLRVTRGERLETILNLVGVASAYLLRGEHEVLESDSHQTLGYDRFADR